MDSRRGAEDTEKEERVHAETWRRGEIFNSVRAELVEALFFFTVERKNGPSTSSGRTALGLAVPPRLRVSA
jgi:hypothetical protein